MSNKVKAILIVSIAFVLVVVVSCVFLGKLPHLKVETPNGSVEVESDDDFPPLPSDSNSL